MTLAYNKNTTNNVPSWQKVGPDVDCLIVHLETAEHTVQRRAPRVTVSRDDAVLPEHLQTNQSPGEG